MPYQEASKPAIADRAYFVASEAAGGICHSLPDAVAVGARALERRLDLFAPSLASTAALMGSVDSRASLISPTVILPSRFLNASFWL